jgi:hypothetical protein
MSAGVASRESPAAAVDGAAATARQTRAIISVLFIGSFLLETV